MSMTAASSGIFLSVVIPVYRAEHILPELHRRLREVLETLKQPFEIVMVDDRSPDNSWSVIQQLAAQHAQLIAIRLSRNFGQHYALTAGLDFARGTWTVIMDCDLQDAPEEIPKLLQMAQEGHDIVLARRIGNPEGPLRRLTSFLFYRLFNLLSGYDLDATVGSFRIMRRTVVEAFCDMRESARLFGGMVQWLGFDVGYVDVSRPHRHAGNTSYTIGKRLQLAIDGMVSFSNRPLYASITLGFGLALASSLYGFALILRYLMHPYNAVPGWLSTFTALVFIGGLILINLGVIGVYLGRVYNQTKARPLYIIDQVVGVPRQGTRDKTADRT